MTDQTEKHEDDPQDRALVHGRLPRNLTARERKVELHMQEAVIERFRRAGLEAGAALAVIRAQKLWRGMTITAGKEKLTMRSFRQYCRTRWGFEASRARQLIGAAQAAGLLREATEFAPTNENQVRPLIRMLGGEESRKLAIAAWNLVNERGQVTDRSVRDALKQMEAAQQPAPPIAEPAELEAGASALAALLDRAYAAMTQLVETMGMTEYHVGVSAEQRQALRRATGEAMGVLREVLAVL